MTNVSTGSPLLARTQIYGLEANESYGDFRRDVESRVPAALQHILNKFGFGQDQLRHSSSSGKVIKPLKTTKEAGYNLNFVVGGDPDKRITVFVGDYGTILTSNTRGL